MLRGANFREIVSEKKMSDQIEEKVEEMAIEEPVEEENVAEGGDANQTAAAKKKKKKKKKKKPAADNAENEGQHSSRRFLFEYFFSIFFDFSMFQAMPPSQLKVVMPRELKRVKKEVPEKAGKRRENEIEKRKRFRLTRRQLPLETFSQMASSPRARSASIQSNRICKILVVCSRNMASLTKF